MMNEKSDLEKTLDRADSYRELKQAVLTLDELDTGHWSRFAESLQKNKMLWWIFDLVGPVTDTAGEADGMQPVLAQDHGSNIAAFAGMAIDNVV